MKRQKLPEAKSTVPSVPVLSIEQYRGLRARMDAAPDWTGQIEWSESVGRPADEEVMARELLFVIANSGMIHTAARKIFDRVMDALYAGRHPSTVFGHPGKAAAMHDIWTRRATLFAEIAPLNDEELVEWCGRLPWIGKITKYHAGKNLGATGICKPDRWLVAIADVCGTTPQALCERLAEESGDRVCTVDLVIWWSLATRRMRLTGTGFTIRSEEAVLQEIAERSCGVAAKAA